jgi:hypothetical protein
MTSDVNLSQADGICNRPESGRSRDMGSYLRREPRVLRSVRYGAEGDGCSSAIESPPPKTAESGRRISPMQYLNISVSSAATIFASIVAAGHATCSKWGSTMRTNLKVILAAMGIAVLTSPVMAGTLRNTHAPLSAELSTDNAFARVQRDRHPSAVVHVNDCAHVAFPQCGASWRRARHFHRHHRV